MTENDIEQAIGQHLAGMGLTPIAWPNADFTPNGTYIEFRHVPGERFDDTIDATGAIQTGIVLLTVVTRSGAFANEANALAAQIAQRFPKALRLVTDTGNVVISAPANPGTPFQDGAYFRKPVSVRYITEPVSQAYMNPALVDVSGQDGLEIIGAQLRVSIDELPEG